MALVRSLLTLDQTEVDWGTLAPWPAPAPSPTSWPSSCSPASAACRPRGAARAGHRRGAPQLGPGRGLPHPLRRAPRPPGLVDQAGLILQAGDLLEDHPEGPRGHGRPGGHDPGRRGAELDPAQRRLLTLLVEGGARDPGGRPGRSHRHLPRRHPRRCRNWARSSPPAWSCSSAAGGSAVPGSTPSAPPGSRSRPGHRPQRRWDHDRGGRPPPRPGRGGGGERPPAPGRPRTGRRPLRPDGHPAAVDPAAQRTHPPGPGAVRRPVPAGRGRAPAGGRAVVGHVLGLFRLALDPARADELLPTLLTSPSAASTPASCVPFAAPPSSPTDPWPTTSAPAPSPTSPGADPDRPTEGPPRTPQVRRP